MTFTITQEHPLTSGEGWWLLKEKLVAAGASVKLSSDATTNGAGDNLDPGGPYTGTLDNTDAWMVIAWPAVGGVTREVCLQFDSTLNAFVTCYWSSDGTGFTGGGATTRPTATDEQWTLNGGDNILPSTADDYPVEVTYHIGDSSEGYSWLLESHIPGENRMEAIAFMDVLENPNAGDNDPAVYGCIGDAAIAYKTSSLLFTSVNVTNAQGVIGGWFDKDGAGEAWVAYPLLNSGFYIGFNTDIAKLSNGTYYGEQDGSFLCPRLAYARADGVTYTPAGGLGLKGVSRFFRQANASLANPSMIVNGLGTLRFAGTIVVPFSPFLPRRWS